LLSADVLLLQRPTNTGNRVEYEGYHDSINYNASSSCRSLISIVIIIIRIISSSRRSSSSNDNSSINSSSVIVLLKIVVVVVVVVVVVQGNSHSVLTIPIDCL